MKQKRFTSPKKASAPALARVEDIWPKYAIGLSKTADLNMFNVWSFEKAENAIKVPFIIGHVKTQFVRNI